MNPPDATTWPGLDLALRSIIDSTMDAIITIDESQRVILFNKAAEEVFGVPAADAIGAKLDRFIPERYRHSHPVYIRGFGVTGDSMRQMGRLGAIGGLRADGTEFPIEASISQTTVNGHKLFTVILRDISEKKNLEEQLLHAQKMEVIGRLAGGIAHDFNNLLMAILNYLTIATKALEPDHPSRAALAQVREASNRAAALTGQLLTFARKQRTKPRVVALNGIVAGLEPMLRRLIPDTIALKTSLSDDARSIRADPAQIEQVIMNLVVNARDAMPSGGVITIETGHCVLDKEYCAAVLAASPGPHAVLTVADTGTGITPEVLKRMFEPFFTTKEPGKGTGLGLATCHGIIAHMGGHFNVKSTPGGGTRVQVLMPSVGEQASAVTAAHESDTRNHGTETVLLAEDSTVVRDLMAAALRQAGYTVLTASGGEEALSLARSHVGRIDLLVTDIVMPSMSGQKLAQELQTQQGPCRVLFVTGGSSADGPSATLDEIAAPVLAKPFGMDVLLRTIREVLDQKRN